MNEWLGLERRRRDPEGLTNEDLVAINNRQIEIERLMCLNLVRSLVRRGYATINVAESYGYDITELGREILKQREEIR